MPRVGGGGLAVAAASKPSAIASLRLDARSSRPICTDATARDRPSDSRAAWVEAAAKTQAAENHLPPRKYAHLCLPPSMAGAMNTKLPNFGGTSASGNDSKYFQTTKKGACKHELAP